MSKTVIFWDFDQTLTIRHTFAEYERGCFLNGETDSELYVLGKQHFENNRKIFPEDTDVKAPPLFAHDDQHAISAIATFHNNPSFIAGFVSKKLHQELMLHHIIYSDTTPLVAVSFYAVGRLNTPFLISWIPAIGHDFAETIGKLQSQHIYKNHQLSLLRQNLIPDYLEPTALIHFCDDSVANVDVAATLPFPLVGYYVDPQQSRLSLRQAFYPSNYLSEQAMVMKLLNNQNLDMDTN